MCIKALETMCVSWRCKHGLVFCLPSSPYRSVVFISKAYSMGETTATHDRHVVISGGHIFRPYHKI